MAKNKIKNDSGTTHAQNGVPDGYSAMHDNDVLLSLQYIRDCQLLRAVEITTSGKLKGVLVALDIVARAQAQIEKALVIAELRKGTTPDNQNISVKFSWAPPIYEEDDEVTAH